MTNSLTTTMTFRISLANAKALKSLPAGTSVHSIVDTLLSEYLAGRLPAQGQVQAIIRAEDARRARVQVEGRAAGIAAAKASALKRSEGVGENGRSQAQGTSASTARGYSLGDQLRVIITRPRDSSVTTE